MFKSVGTLINTIPSRTKVPEAILALQVRQAAQKALRQVCIDLPGEVLATVKISAFKNGTLVISTSTLLACELQLRSGRLVEEINRGVGARLLRSLRFRVN